MLDSYVKYCSNVFLFLSKSSCFVFCLIFVGVFCCEMIDELLSFLSH